MLATLLYNLNLKFGAGILVWPGTTLHHDFSAFIEVLSSAPGCFRVFNTPLKQEEGQESERACTFPDSLYDRRSKQLMMQQR